MQVAIVGSRDGFTKQEVFKYLKNCTWMIPNDTIITGGARGVDTYAIEFASKMGIFTEVIRPINPSHKLDYFYRNIEILTKADLVIAFWDRESKGTKFVIDYARARDKYVEVINNGIKDI